MNASQANTCIRVKIIRLKTLIHKENTALMPDRGPYYKPVHFCLIIMASEERIFLLILTIRANAKMLCLAKSTVSFDIRNFSKFIKALKKKKKPNYSSNNQYNQ